MAAIPFVDTHVHFHDMAHPRLRYEWLEPATPIDPVVGRDGAIKCQSYLADDFLAETRFHNVAKVVHVQAAIGSEDPVEETRWLSGFAERLGIPHGIIGYVDLAAPDAEDMLDRHCTFPNFRGVRDLRYDDYLSDPAWQSGYRLLGGRGLVACGDPLIEQMPLARRIIDSAPDIVFCLDHAGYPEHAGNPRAKGCEHFDAWRSALRLLAEAGNTVVKISGLGQSDHRWTVERLRPWVLECIDAFGADRAFFGTNWPVDRLYSSYGDVIDAYAEIIADFTAEEQHALFHGNAERIFRLSDAAADPTRANEAHAI